MSMAKETLDEKGRRWKRTLKEMEGTTFFNAFFWKKQGSPRFALTYKYSDMWPITCARLCVDDVIECQKRNERMRLRMKNCKHLRLDRPFKNEINCLDCGRTIKRRKVK